MLSPEVAISSSGCRERSVSTATQISSALQTRYIVVAYVRNGELIPRRPTSAAADTSTKNRIPLRLSYPACVSRDSAHDPPPLSVQTSTMPLRSSPFRQTSHALTRSAPDTSPRKGRHRSHRWLMTHHTTVATAHWEALPFAATVTVRGASSLTASPCGATVTSFGGRGISSIGGKRIGHS